MMKLKSRPFSPTERLAISALLIPILGWSLLLTFVEIKKNTPPRISGKPVLHVDTWLVGSRFLLADIHGDLTRTTDDQWTGERATVTLDPKAQSLIFESPAFETPATLIYDGFKWHGFTTKAGRGMPIAVEAWPDF